MLESVYFEQQAKIIFKKQYRNMYGIQYFFFYQ